jgi:hypothetical protein
MVVRDWWKRRSEVLLLGPYFDVWNCWEPLGKVKNMFSSLIKLIKGRQIVQGPTQVTKELENRLGGVFVSRGLMWWW